MATSTMGHSGDPRPTNVTVCRPYKVEQDTIIEFEVVNGQKVTIELTRDDELRLLSDLAARMALRAKPIETPKPLPVVDPKIQPAEW